MVSQNSVIKCTKDFLTPVIKEEFGKILCTELHDCFKSVYKQKINLPDIDVLSRLRQSSKFVGNLSLTEKGKSFLFYFSQSIEKYLCRTVSKSKRINRY